jgi:hypothetical protein
MNDLQSGDPCTEANVNEQVPRVWIKEFGISNPWRALYFKQSIKDAIRDLMADPSVSLALPLIPGLPVEEILYSEDVKTVGDRHGMLVTTTAMMASSAIETELLVYEKLCKLKKVNKTSPGLVAKVLGIRNEARFLRFFFRFGKHRNRLAHPAPERISSEELDFALIPDDYKQYARMLAEWDPTQFVGSTLSKKSDTQSP